MTTAKKRVGRTLRKAKRDEEGRLGAWTKLQQQPKGENNVLL